MQLNCTAPWKICVANDTPAKRGRKRLIRTGASIARKNSQPGGSHSRDPLLPMVLTSGHPRERQRVCDLPPGVAFLPKPWQPFNVLVVAEEAGVCAGQELKGSPP